MNYNAAIEDAVKELVYFYGWPRWLAGNVVRWRVARGFAPIGNVVANYLEYRQ